MLGVVLGDGVEKDGREGGGDLGWKVAGKMVKMVWKCPRLVDW